MPSEAEHIGKETQKTSEVPCQHAEQPSELNALFNAAYDHPAESAAAALAIAATALAVVVKHTPAGKLLGLTNKVLLIEDTPIFSHVMREALEKQGASVTILKGVESLKPFVGILEDGAKRKLNLSTYRGAFVDGNLYGALRGQDIMPTLQQKRVFTIAMSSQESTNDAMRLAGANLATRKPVVMQLLDQDKLPIDDAIANPAETQRRFEDLTAHFHDKEQQEARVALEKKIKAQYQKELANSGDDKS